MIAASIVTDFWDRISDHHLQGLYLVLIGFILSFAFIRMSTRLMRSPRVPWWPGSIVSDSGVHLHHLVFGIVAMMVAGFLEFALAPPEPWVYGLAALFGTGAGLTLDEFALWLRLEDVYWAKEGRESVDAVVVAVVFGALVLVGLSPLDIEGVESWWAVAAVGSLNLALVAITILKGKLVAAMIGLFVPAVALVGAVRLAKPGSPWAHRRDADDPSKLRRAQKRHAKREGLRTRLRDLIAGAPSGR
jgi:hypothetical protein